MLCDKPPLYIGLTTTTGGHVAGGVVRILILDLVLLEQHGRGVVISGVRVDIKQAVWLTGALLEHLSLIRLMVFRHSRSETGHGMFLSKELAQSLAAEQ